jgi:hypothetical protein
MRAVSAALILASLVVGTFAPAASTPPPSQWQKVTVRIYPANLSPETRLDYACGAANLLEGELKDANIAAQAKVDAQALVNLVCRKSN